MRVPRWATYPAIAVILIVAILALPRGRPGRGAAQQSRRTALTQPAPPQAPTGAASTAGSAASSAAPELGATLRLVDFLPAGYATDGSVDYRAELQLAIETAVGTTLELPDFPVLVRRAPGKSYGVRVLSATRIVGKPSALLFTDEPGLQLLRGEGVQNLVLEGFALRGPGGDGQAMGHGLVQITGGSDVALRHLDVWSADADGIALSQVARCRVESCVVVGASKSGLYLADCAEGLVRSNLVREFGGHVLADGSRVGVGIQLSSCRDVVCSDNLVADGLGVGILCNAFQGGPAPKGNLIANNRVRSVANPDNPNVSGGVRLANGNPDTRTDTLVTGNSVSDCGWNGLYVEHHDGSLITGNLVTRSERAGILVSAIDGVVVSDNLVTASGAAGPAAPALQLVNGARGVQARDNATDAPDAAPAQPLNDGAGSGGWSSLEPRVVHRSAPPARGVWQRGDLVYNAQPAQGAPLGWVCLAGGAPGTWAPFGRVE